MIAGYHIPKGTHMGITIVGLHRNPKVWPNPLKFDPERWYVAHTPPFLRPGLKLLKS